MRGIALKDDDDFVVKKHGIIIGIDPTSITDDVEGKYTEEDAKKDKKHIVYSTVSIGTLLNESEWTPTDDEKNIFLNIIDSLPKSRKKDIIYPLLGKLNASQRELIVKFFYYKIKRNQSYNLFKSDFRRFMDCEELYYGNQHEYRRIAEYLIEIKHS